MILLKKLENEIEAKLPVEIQLMREFYFSINKEYGGKHNGKTGQ